MDKIFNVVFCYEDGENCAPEKLSAVFTGEYLAIYLEASEKGNTVYAGLGKHEEVKKDKIKNLSGKVAKELSKLKATKAVIEAGHLIETFGEKALYPITEGFNLGSYVFDEYKQKRNEHKTEYSYTLNGNPLCEKTSAAATKGENIAKGVNLARELVNIPANHLTPAAYAEKMKEVFANTDVEVEVFDEKQCEEMGMGSFLAVGNSSDYKPRLIVLRYMNNKDSEEVLGYVGKGITYDTGGYSLKSSMLGMKGDMAGSAAVAGAVYSLAINKVKTNVVGVLVCCENRLSNSAIVPGDVIKTMNSQTIEVTNTDAEGRLILVDGITYAIRKEKATKIVDIATLTGSMASTLGGHRAGIFTNNDELLKDFKQAAKKCGERYWQFPIDDVYRKMIKSEIADMRNSGDRIAGAIFAACFIEAYTENTPWIHMDIAGCSNTQNPNMEYQVKGATGFGAETLYALACEGEE